MSLRTTFHAAANDNYPAGVSAHWDVSYRDEMPSPAQAASIPDFSAATAAVVQLNSGDDFHARLVEQLERDASEIRSKCAVVRDPAKPRVISYASGNDIMAATRQLCR